MMEQAIVKAIKEKLHSSDVANITHLPGGMFHQFYIYDTDVGRFFVKTGKTDWLPYFEAEAKSLRTIDDTASVKVPTPHYYGKCDKGSFLILDYIPLSSHTAVSQKLLGSQIAKMHQTKTANSFGFEFDTTIGANKQINKWTRDWIDFYRDYRLRYQLKLVESNHKDQEIKKLGDKLCERLSDYFKGIKVIPSLLHGDLWSGNTGVDAKGNPVVYDPGSYYGHHEAELGIMKVFGGFSSDFFDAYHAHLPKEVGFEQREKCYKLYHCLNHYNLFGESYRSDCLDLLQDF